MKDCIAKNILKDKETGIYRKTVGATILSEIHVARIEQAPHSEIFTIGKYNSHGSVREVCLAHLSCLVNQNGKNE